MDYAYEISETLIPWNTLASAPTRVAIAARKNPVRTSSFTTFRSIGKPAISWWCIRNYVSYLMPVRIHVSRAESVDASICTDEHRSCPLSLGSRLILRPRICAYAARLFVHAYVATSARQMFHVTYRNSSAKRWTMKPTVLGGLNGCAGQTGSHVDFPSHLRGQRCSHHENAPCPLKVVRYILIPSVGMSSPRVLPRRHSLPLRIKLLAGSLLCSPRFREAVSQTVLVSWAALIGLAASS